MRGYDPRVHLHLSFLSTWTAFVGVLVWGTVWRLVAAHLVGRNAQGTTANKIGRAMAFQY